MILQKIADATKVRVANLQKQKSLETVRSEAESLVKGEFANDYGTFAGAIGNPGMNFICEVKKASPSKGVIAETFNPLQIASEYEAAGAAAVSCLTEPKFFLGSDRYLEEIAKKVSIPVLRKDFTVSDYQIYEARALGASAILLICALLPTEELKEYLAISESLGLDVLVEVHDEYEIESALKAEAKIIGVNNRNLKDFTVDINNSIRLRKLVPQDVLFVSESGIKTREDIEMLENNGTNAVLIGETLMRSANIAEALKVLRGK